jgi:hypothetical protein
MVSYMMPCMVLLVLCLTYVLLMYAESQVPSVLGDIVEHRTALVRHASTNGEPTNHSACHTSNQESEWQHTRSAADVTRSRKQGGTRLDAGTCFHVGDHGLMMADGSARVRVSRVGQAELVLVDANVVMATWPKTPLRPNNPDNDWRMCLQMDGDLCLIHEYLYRDSKPLKRCASSGGLPIHALEPTDGLILRSVHELCLKRSSGWDQCTAQFWHVQPTPDERLVTLAQNALLVARMWVVLIGVIALAMLFESYPWVEPRVGIVDAKPWNTTSLNSLAFLVMTSGAKVDQIAAAVDALPFPALPETECVRMSQLLGGAGLFAVQAAFCRKVSAAQVTTRLNSTAVMAHLFSHGNVSREALSDTMDIAGQFSSLSGWQALGVWAMAHGHLDYAMEALRLSRNTDGWRHALKQLAQINDTPLPFKLCTLWCRNYVDWIGEKVLESDSLVAPALKALNRYILVSRSSSADASSSASSSPSSSNPKSPSVVAAPPPSSSFLVAPICLDVSPAVTTTSALSSASSCLVASPGPVSTSSDPLSRVLTQLEAYESYVSHPPSDLTQDSWLLIDKIGHIQHYKTMVAAMRDPLMMTDTSAMLRQYPSEHDVWSLLRARVKGE